MKSLILICLFVTGCAGSFQIGKPQGEITRAELSAAFQQRDQMILDLGKQLKELQDGWIKK